MPLMTISDLPADLAGRSDAQRLLDAAIALAEQFCKRPFFYATAIDEVFDGGSQPAIFLKATPIAAVTWVTIDGRSILDYEFNATTGRLWRGTGHSHPDLAPYFPAGHENVAVRYNGGYQTCPGDLKYAISEGVRGLVREQGRDGTLKSETFSGDYSWTAADKPGEFDIFSSSAKSILRKYRTSGNHVIG